MPDNLSKTKKLELCSSFIVELELAIIPMTGTCSSSWAWGYDSTSISI